MKESMPAVRVGPSTSTYVGALGTAITDDDLTALLWDQMTLSAQEAAPRAMALPAELSPVLRLFETAADGSRTGGGPSSPSAGGLYPYEHYAVVAGHEAPAVYALDAVRRSCRLMRTGPEVSRALERGGFDVPGHGESLVMTVIRPWPSMRKYGDRGYLYSQLDAAHLAAHLLCVGSETHDGAELRTRANTAPLSDLLGLDASCRLTHSVLLLGPPLGGQTEPGHAWTCVDDDGGPPNGVESFWLETECWKSLAAHRADRIAGGAGITVRDVRLRPLLADRSGAEPFPGGVALTALAARRRSTEDFGPAPIPAEDLDRVLAALYLPLATDLIEDSGLRATLVARSVTGRAPGSHPLYLPPGEPTVPAPDDDQVVRACMGQKHLRHASAVVLFHVPRRDLLGDGVRGMDDALLRSGILAHLLYLGAAGAGIDITAIGGFDSGRWGTLAGLPERDEVLYVVTLGRSGRSSVKLDRLNPTYAHNER